MFTYDGIRTTPRERNDAVARDRRRHDPHAELLVAGLERDLVVVLERPDLARLHLPRPEEVEDRRLHVLVDAQSSPRGSATRSSPRSSAAIVSSVVTGPRSRISAARSHSACGRHEREVSRSPRPPGRRTSPGRRGCRARAAGARTPRRRRRRRARGRTSRRRRRAAALRLEHGEEDVALAAVERRAPPRRASSSDQAATAARWTNSCGAVPTDGRNVRSASATSGGAQTKPQR